MSDFNTFFEQLTGFTPWPWQAQLGSDLACRDRLIRIPTGFGKTAGVATAWAFHRLVRKQRSWPNRLIVVLPMRVLVEQTISAMAEWLGAVDPEVRVWPAMGGAYDGGWALEPQQPCVIIGTQDMLLSRALNRGYGASRGRWPVDFGLLHHDALWVFDEIQLMDVGLTTSVQLAALRGQAPTPLRPSHTWWMSATLQPRWLATHDFQDTATDLADGMLQIPQQHQQGGLWEVDKRLHLSEASEPSRFAADIVQAHQASTLTLAVVNTVDRAIALHTALRKTMPADGPDLRLVHSRFRGAERQGWAREFLHRDASMPEEGRIIVATQVVEAGVDISARTLFTDLAPWPSLVQRFGRAGRYRGEQADVHVVGPVPDSDRGALPYTAGELVAAHAALRHVRDRLGSVAPRDLEVSEHEIAAAQPELLAAMYPHDPMHVLRGPDLADLFDTTPDMSGTDLDISRFVRTGDARDVRVFWAPVKTKDALAEIERPPREALCPVPIGKARKWLKDRDAWVFDYLDAGWRRVRARDLVPGMELLVRSAEGGYRPDRGFDPKSRAPVDPVTEAGTSPALDLLARFDDTAAGVDADNLSKTEAFKTIATHGRETCEAVHDLAASLALPSDLTHVLDLAARWHDTGKAHPVFQDAIQAEARRDRFGDDGPRDLAKAPRGAWHRYAKRGFRHELASGLALLALLRRAAPSHPGLIGELSALHDLLEEQAADLSPDLMAHPLAAEIVALTGEDFDLLLWLVITHHGKVRCSWVGTHHDQRGHIHGIRTGDALAPMRLPDAAGRTRELPPLTLDLAPAQMGFDPTFGRSWSERVARLRRAEGDFRLAFLEAVLRAADVRASRLQTEDDLC